MISLRAKKPLRIRGITYLRSLHQLLSHRAHHQGYHHRSLAQSPTIQHRKHRARVFMSMRILILWHKTANGVFSIVKRIYGEVTAAHRTHRTQVACVVGTSTLLRVMHNTTQFNLLLLYFIV